MANRSWVVLTVAAIYDAYSPVVYHLLLARVGHRSA